MCPTLGSMHFSRATRVREWCVNRVHGADGRHRVVLRGRNRRESARVPSSRKTAVQGLRLGEYSDHIVVHQLHKEALNLRALPADQNRIRRRRGNRSVWLL